MDVGAAERIEAVPAHTGPVWSLAALPDSSGATSYLLEAAAKNSISPLVCCVARSVERHADALGCQSSALPPTHWPMQSEEH